MNILYHHDPYKIIKQQRWIARSRRSVGFDAARAAFTFAMVASDIGKIMENH